MGNPVKIKMPMPDHRAKVLFKDQTKPTFILSADKAASDAQNFREAADIIRAHAPVGRPRQVADWLDDLASKYVSGEAA